MVLQTKNNDAQNQKNIILSNTDIDNEKLLPYLTRQGILIYTALNRIFPTEKSYKSLSKKATYFR